MAYSKRRNYRGRRNSNYSSRRSYKPRRSYKTRRAPVQVVRLEIIQPTANPINQPTEFGLKTVAPKKAKF